MQLSEAKSKEEYTVVHCDVSEKVAAKLGSLGIVTGQRVRVLMSTFAGLILEVKGSRLAVSKSLAKHMMVAP
jgi:Fe2+ transport system protein FeoA